MKKSLIVTVLILISMPVFSWAQSPCPGWVAVPLDWNKNVKDFCAQYGTDCRAVAMMYEPPNNEMSLDPLYGEYDDLALVHPDSKVTDSCALQARSIKCEEFVVTPEMASAKAADQKSKQDCEQKKGIWGRVEGRGRVKGCNLPTADAGKKCSDSSQCESACVADKVSGQNKCYGWQTFKGCGKIESNKVVCVD